MKQTVVVALANKGMMYIQKNDADNAIKCLKQALAAKEDNVVLLTALYILIYALRRRKNK